MTTAEKLIKVAENVPKVYEAGYERGKAEGGSCVRNVSLIDLNEKGCFETIESDNGSPSEVISENRYMAQGKGQIISISGYVDFKINFGFPYSKVIIDGKTVFDNSEGEAPIYEFKHECNVKENITIYTQFSTFVTFDHFTLNEEYGKGYEDGFEDGVAEGGAEYEFENVSLVDLQEKGRLTVENHRENGFFVITENTLHAEEATFHIGTSGYVEFEGTVDTFDYIFITVDDEIIYSNEKGGTEFFFSGEVKEKLSVYASLCAYTFDRFVIRKDYDKGVADGKQAEYDRFWDRYQDNGTRMIYNYAFAGWGWYDEIFKPKHEFPKFSYCNYMFQSNSLTKIPYTLDLTEVALASGKRNVTNLFNGATSLKEVKEVKVNEEVVYNTWFNNCNKLEEICFTGTIGQSGLDFHWSTGLTAASLLSILKALSKDKTVASGKNITFATASQAVIQADAKCTEQYNLALTAGWEIKFA